MLDVEAYYRWQRIALFENIPEEEKAITLIKAHEDGLQPIEALQLAKSSLSTLPLVPLFEALIRAQNLSDKKTTEERPSREGRPRHKSTNGKRKSPNYGTN